MWPPNASKLVAQAQVRRAWAMAIQFAQRVIAHNLAPESTPSTLLRGLRQSMTRSHSIAVIGGDGIGPEVTRAALRVLDAAERRFGFSTSRTEYDWSSERYLSSPRPVTPEDLDGLR